MPALHVRDIPEETIAAIKQHAARRGHSMQQELREVLERAATEPIVGGRTRPLNLTTVATDRTSPFDRDDFYEDDER